MDSIILEQMPVLPGNPEANLKRVLEGIDRARNAGKSLVVFPEMAIPGYLLGDEWENDAFVRECAEMNEEIRAATKDGIGAIWGNVLVDSSKKNEDGRIRKYNAAFVAQNGEYVGNGAFEGHTVKSLMPKYREFDDERHFHSLLKLASELGVAPESLIAPFELVISWVKKRVGIIICEDMWDEDYAFKPVSVLKSKGIDAIVNVSASPYGLGKSAKRERILSVHSKGTRFYYANNVGIQNNGKNVFLFDGGTSVYENGFKIAEAHPFYEQSVTEGSGRFKSLKIGNEELRDMAEGLLLGIRKFMESIGKKKLVIGLSGGLDSAVVATLAVMALGEENVTAVNMPSRFNSETTKNLAAQLAKNLRIPLFSIPIEESVNATKSKLEAVLGMKMEGLNWENAQARDRWSRVLAGIASMLDAVFTNNGNKTEVALGYATLYGDVNGAFAPIADLYKSQVFELARYLNRTYGDSIPKGIIDLPPSAELSEAQNVDAWLGDPFDYPVTDSILYQMIELRRDPENLLQDWIDGTADAIFAAKDGRTAKDIFGTPERFIAEIERTWKLYKNSFFKRVQAPPIITVSKRAFGYDLRESQNGVHFTRRYEVLKERILDGGAPQG